MKPQKKKKEDMMKDGTLFTYAVAATVKVETISARTRHGGCIGVLLGTGHHRAKKDKDAGKPQSLQAFMLFVPAKGIWSPSDLVEGPGQAMEEWSRKIDESAVPVGIIRTIAPYGPEPCLADAVMLSRIQQKHGNAMLIISNPDTKAEDQHGYKLKQDSFAKLEGLQEEELGTGHHRMKRGSPETMAERCGFSVEELKQGSRARPRSSVQSDL